MLLLRKTGRAAPVRLRNEDGDGRRGEDESKLITVLDMNRNGDGPSVVRIVRGEDDRAMMRRCRGSCWRTSDRSRVIEKDRMD